MEEAGVNRSWMLAVKQKLSTQAVIISGERDVPS